MRFLFLTICLIALNGCVTSNSYDNLSVQQLAQKAEQGDSEASLKLGIAYSKGERGVAVDRVKAAKWIIHSAEAGNAIAQNTAGSLYITGLGVEKNIDKGVELIKASANQGYAPAQNTLSFYYSTGYGVEKNEEEAIKWKEKAVLNGCKETSHSGTIVTKC